MIIMTPMLRKRSVFKASRDIYATPRTSSLNTSSQSRRSNAEQSLQKSNRQTTLGTPVQYAERPLATLSWPLIKQAFRGTNFLAVHISHAKFLLSVRRRLSQSRLIDAQILFRGRSPLHRVPSVRTQCSAWVTPSSTVLLHSSAS
jgi:hypothetical protein